MHTYMPTYIQNFTEKGTFNTLIVFQLVNKLLTCCGTRWFIIVFTKARHQSTYSAIESVPRPHILPS